MCDISPLGGGRHEPHHRATKQMTHKLKNNYTKEVFALLQKFQGPQQISQPGDPEKGLRTPREFEGQWDLIIKLLKYWGERFSEGTTKPCAHKTQEKGAVTPQETEPDLPVRVQESPAEAWIDSGLPGDQRHLIQQSWELWHVGMSSFEGGGHYCHYPYNSLALGQTTGREHSPTHQQNIGLKIY